MSQSMRKRLLNLKSRLAEFADEMEAISTVADEENRDLSDEEMKRYEEINAEFASLETQIKSLEKTIATQEKIEQRRILDSSLQHPNATAADGQKPVKAIPARCTYQKSKVFKTNYEAYAMGMWLAATLRNNQSAVEWCRTNGIGSYRNDMNEGTDIDGGFTVPAPLAATIIELFEQWGIFRQFARNVPMTSETLRVPRLDGSLTVYYPGEANAITASDLVFGQVGLTAQKAAQLGVLSTELNEDSVISVVDLLARDMARNYAYTEDLGAFLGTGVAGTPTGAGPLVGIISALDDGAKITTAVGADKWGAVTMQNLLSMIGKTKEYPGFTGRWYMNKFGYYGSVVDLLLTLGGTDMRQGEAGPEMYLLGYPVTFTQVLPGEAAATGNMLAVFGDLDLGAYLGTRRNVSIRTLTETFAVNDQLGVISTMRHDVNIHSVGTATEAGCITALIAGADA